MAVIRRAVRSENEGLVDDVFRTQDPGLFAGTDETIAVLEAETATKKLEVILAGTEVWTLVLSPDDKTLAATSGREVGKFHLYDVGGGKAIRTLDSPPLHPSDLRISTTQVLAFTPDRKRLVTGMSDDSILVRSVQAGP